MCPRIRPGFDPDFDPLLAGIVARDPQSLVVLLAGPYPYAAEQLRSRFERTIPAGRERIVFLPYQKFDDYCRLLQIADVVVDPPHFGAGSSCYDIFSFNQPLVTLPGELMVSRVASAFYRKMGIEDLIAATPADYIDLAVRLASDPDWRSSLRQRLAAASGILFDDLEAVRDHERFFEAALAGQDS